MPELGFTNNIDMYYTFNNGYKVAHLVHKCGAYSADKDVHLLNSHFRYDSESPKWQRCWVPQGWSHI